MIALLAMFLSEYQCYLLLCFAAESDSLRGKLCDGGRRTKLLCIKNMTLKDIATHH